MSYDPQCYDLAKSFLEDAQRTENLTIKTTHIAQLAQEIQTTIETFIQSLEDEKDRLLHSALMKLLSPSEVTE